MPSACATEPVGAEELDTAKSALLAELAAAFASPRDAAVTYALDDVTGGPHDDRHGYRARLLAVSAADIQKMPPAPELRAGGDGDAGGGKLAEEPGGRRPARLPRMPAG